MLKIRLQRRGKRNYATYRVVVAQASAPIKGRFIADLGSYNPHTDAFVVDKDAATRWISQGAQASSTVHNLLVEHKVITAAKVTSWRPKTRTEAETGEATKAPEETQPVAESTTKEQAEEN